LDIEPTPEMIVENQLKKDYGEFDYNASLRKKPSSKFDKRPAFLHHFF